ncbi:unnamed protein product [Blepharisma stoltei]|uniref:Ubiquitin-like domain-containing protein n=1 Tax=Blepharisma stoltei TaxID=1481888 RepID=A0AAU9KJR3_9CILI|nr:unnamed protein product [Blepharisma stoltei]
MSRLRIQSLDYGPFLVPKPSFESTNSSDSTYREMKLDELYLALEKKGIPIPKFALYFNGKRLKRSNFIEAINSTENIQLLSSKNKVMSMKLQIKIGVEDFCMIVKNPQKLTIWRLIIKIAKLRGLCTENLRKIKCLNKFVALDYDQTLNASSNNCNFALEIKEESKRIKRSWKEIKFHSESRENLLSISVSPTKTIRKLKQLVCLKTLNDLPYIKLVKNNVPLQESQTIESEINDGDIIEIIKHRPGGLVGGLCFNSLNEIVEKRFDDEAPDWRSVKPGLSWRCECENEECRAYKEYVVVNIGFGSFDVAKVIWNLKCPECKQGIEIGKISNIGFHKTDWRIDGRLQSGKVVERSGEAGSEQYMTFQDGVTAEWAYLTIEAVDCHDRKIEPC